MANADREIRERLMASGAVAVNLEHVQENESTFYIDLLVEFIKSREAALLDRIKEEGPEDMIAHTKDGGQPRLYYRQVGFNSSNKTWRTTIDNIAKEIRGEV